MHEILDGYEDPEYIQITANIAMHHHEKWDGSGYPEGLKGEQIPLCARIMAIADVFDALVSPRIYKSPMSYEEAYQIIEEGIGIHFDPIIAKEFLNNQYVFELIKDLDMNYGNIICKVNLVDCIYMDEKFLKKIKKNKQEYNLGKYELGRYAWVFEDIVPITPIEAKGKLNIWNYN